MKIEKTRTNVRLMFRVNGRTGTAGDESAELCLFLQYLATTFLPFSTYRLMFIDSETDDSIHVIQVDKNTFETLLVYRNEWPIEPIYYDLIRYNRKINA